MRLSIILFLVFISVADSFCQNRNSVWCFGDSALIDFSNPGNPITGWSSVRNRGSSVSIADTSGQLLFYAHTRHGVAGNTTWVKNNAHQLMQNGDNIVGEGWYNELVIIPYPNHPDLYYLFSVSETGSSQLGLYYSIIDMSMNAGLGAVTQKNIQLLSFAAQDGIKAIKHGNGRDWWVMFRNWGGGNQFYLFLVDSSGIQPQLVQSIGSLSTGGTIEDIVFTHDGSKFYLKNSFGLLERFDFDRCSGLISNPLNILPQGSGNFFAGIALSKNDSVLYLTINNSSDHGYLYQYDLSAPNIAASKITIFDFDYTFYPSDAVGYLRLAPDDKIYLSNRGLGGVYYDSTDYTSFNMNLSVINTPNSVGTTCAFQPYSFYLGGKRTYYGLPNNPDYDMPRLQGSPCDTIQWTGVQNIEQPKGLLYVTYVSSWQKLFINAQGLKGRSFKMSVYDMIGNVIYTEEGKLSGQYFTRDLNMAAFAKGMYIVNFVTDKERLVKKFIKD